MIVVSEVYIGMPRLAWPLSSMAALVDVVLVMGLVLNVAVVCNGGKTSTFVRKVDLSADMPLHSDVFQVPPSYNVGP